LVKLVIDSYLALKEVDGFIEEHIVVPVARQLLKDEEPKNPLELLGKEGMDACRQFLLKSPRGAQILKNFEAKLEKLKREAAKGISYEVENQFGYSATHIGLALNNWVKPVGQPGSGHRPTSADMMSKADVHAKKVLQKCKSEQEHKLYERRKDMTNHAFTHQCSDYCWKAVVIDVWYDPSKHGQLENNDRIVSSKKAPDGTQLIPYKVFECRMGFGFQNRIPVHGDRMGGALPVRVPNIGFDGNGQPKYYGP
jgi:hypothetical protein